MEQHLLDNGWIQNIGYPHMFTQGFKTIYVSDTRISIFFKKHSMGQYKNEVVLTSNNILFRYFIEGDNIEEKSENPFE